MTDPTPVWPAPTPTPGKWIRHTYKCPRTDPVAESTRRTPAGVILAVDQCSGCGGTDYVWRIERARWRDERADDGGDAA